ncbi:MAG: hypothetical protein E6Q58_05020 [Niabella sp.]|nr:MAG: hypothetical protein E6Q58_05020 [Niabella sp.]
MQRITIIYIFYLIIVKRFWLFIYGSIFFFNLLFISRGFVLAKQGCCSWHGGVSSCDSSVGRYVCNDGSYSPSCTCEVSKPKSQTFSQPVKPKCSANATYNDTTNTCYCNNGYAVSTDKKSCVKIPANAHAITSSTDAWECDQGFIEKNGKCELLTISTPSATPTPTIEISPSISTTPLINSSVQATSENLVGDNKIVEEKPESDSPWIAMILPLLFTTVSAYFIGVNVQKKKHSQ